MSYQSNLYGIEITEGRGLELGKRMYQSNLYGIEIILLARGWITFADVSIEPLWN